MLTNDNAETRRMVERCYKRHKTSVNPIIEWSDCDVWEFIKAERIPYCGLYDDGFDRLGCIGCPIAGKHKREREFVRWPKYKDAYLLAFEKMIAKRKERHERDPSRPVWKANGCVVGDATPLDVFRWWMEYDVLPGQIGLFEDYEEETE